MFKCPRCNNTDERYLGYLNGKVYCRRCILFSGNSNNKKSLNSYKTNKSILHLDYSLTKEQQLISNQIVQSITNKKNVLVKAVCGAGKTEIVFEIMIKTLHENKKVGFAIPRRNVVIDLEKRIRQAFPHNKIISVYGGHTEDLNGDITILTTHQLYRYVDYFDLIVLDEVDAYPFYLNTTLYSILRKSLKGNIVVLSATANREIVDEFKKRKDTILELNVRYHHMLIPVPEIIKKNIFTQIYFIIKKIKQYRLEKKKCFIYVPTIEIGIYLYRVIYLFCTNGQNISSKTKRSKQIIEEFGKGHYDYLITTSILERGVTFPNLQVIIFMANHNVYSKEMIIQIGGRVGRKKDFPTGDVFLLANKVTSQMKEAINEINNANKYLSNVL